MSLWSYLRCSEYVKSHFYTKVCVAFGFVAIIFEHWFLKLSYSPQSSLLIVDLHVLPLVAVRSIDVLIIV
jgi:hypothetical protein